MGLMFLPLVSLILLSVISSRPGTTAISNSRPIANHDDVISTTTTKAATATSKSKSPQRRNNKRSYAQRTAARRRRTQELLQRITAPPFVDSPSSLDDAVSRLGQLNDAPSIDWDSSSHNDNVVMMMNLIDPQKGGRLQAETPRSRRKRVQVEAFCHLCRTILTSEEGEEKDGNNLNKNQNHYPKHNSKMIVDAGAGAGNLALPLAALLQQPVLAIDMNQKALKQLDRRAQELNEVMRIMQQGGSAKDDHDKNNIPTLVTTLCADLATAALPPGARMISSLHACGAATDMALRLATQHRVPFVMSPCCTGKANVERPRTNKHGLVGMEKDEISTDFQLPEFYPKSGAPADITYPRSQWLRDELKRIPIATSTPSAADEEKHNNHPLLDETSTNDPTVIQTRLDQHYTTLAKVADVGLGPQTPPEQVRHQQMAKYAVEMDRLVGVVEQHGYKVQMYRLPGHDNYGKAEIFCGVPAEHPAATTMEWMEFGMS